MAGKSMFQTGPDDELLVVDGYNRTVEEYTPLKQEDAATVEPPRPDIKSEKELKEKKDSDRKEAASKPSPATSSKDAEAAMSALAEVSPGSAPALSKLTDDEKKAVENAVKEAREKEKDIVFDTGRGISTVITPDGEFSIDPESGAKMQGGLKIFANLFGDSFVCGLLENTGDLLASLRALFDLSLDIEIQECLTDILKNVKSDSTRRVLLREAGETFAKKGQIGGLDKVITEAGPDIVSQSKPDLVEVTLSNYKKPRFIDDGSGNDTKRPVTPNDNAQLYTQLDTTLKKVDPHWGYYKRDDEWIPDAQIFSKLSPDAKRVVGSDREKRVYVEVAKSYYPKDRTRHVERSRDMFIKA